MLQDAGIDNTNKSNHSLRATAIMRMMEKNIPSKVMQRSRHLSKDGLVPYERTTPLQQTSSCKALDDVTLEKVNQVQHVSTCSNTSQIYIFISHWAWHIIECVLELYRPAGRKSLLAYISDIQTGTNSCSIFPIQDPLKS